jgi:alpha-glucosidase
LDGKKITVKERGETEASYTRRDFLAAAAIAPFVVTGVLSAKSLAKGPTRITSPDGLIRFELTPDLHYSVSLRNKPVVETAKLGIVVDGVDLGQSATIGKMTTYRTRDQYVWRGIHAKAVNRCNGVKVAVHYPQTKTDYTIEIRVFDDGVAFRYLLPDVGKTRVPEEASTFVFPAGSTAWFHDFYGHYEGTHVKKAIADVKEGEWAAPPLTIKLPGNDGYAAVTEAALFDYAGMGLQADGNRGFKGVLGNALPVSHPYDLRYPKEEAKRLSIPASFPGAITTPWRVVMIGADLNALVNSDAINNVSPAPDKNFFPQGFETSWLRPGRAVWKYLDGGESTLDGMKEFSRLAGDLGFEHNIVEGFWRRWTEEQMRELVDYSKQFNVGIWFWAHSKDLHTPESRQALFSQLNRVGVVGSKIDFFDHEAKEIIDLYNALLKDAAEHKIMLEFHGANKPTGQTRTWPNELTREAIRGMEYRSMTERAVHNTTLPFTRFLAGPADYTPMHFGERRRETSWAHQIATAAVFTSPLMIYGAHPKNILENPAVDLIKSIPSVWDVTIVLPVSEISEIAVFARRKGDTWFLALLNGPVARSVNIPLSFLSAREYKAMLVRDNMEDPAAVLIENSSVRNRDSIKIYMRPGGGFIARFM